MGDQTTHYIGDPCPGGHRDVSLSDEDRLLVDAITDVDGDADLDALIGVHERALRDAYQRRDRLSKELDGVQRIINMREYARSRLAVLRDQRRSDDG